MPLSDAQRQIAESPARFRSAICGRRFGKTHLAIRELARYSREPNRLSWYIAPTRGQGKGIVWEQLKERLGQLNWIAKTNESDLVMTLVNGSQIEIRSADSYDRMRGFSVSGIAVFDEFADMDPEVWTAVRPTLSDKNGHALFIGTPKGGRSSWAYEIYANGINRLEDWQSWSFTTLDGGNVPENEIEAAKRDMPERMFRQEYMATWEESAGQIYYAFDRNHNVRSIDSPDISTIYVGMDFNITPLCAVIAVRINEDLYVIDEITLYSSNTHDLASEIRSRYPKTKVFCYPDPAGSARSTKSQGQSDHTILANQPNFIVKAPRNHTPVRDRINAVNARLCSASGVRHLFIAPQCKYVIQCLERQVYKEGSNAIPEKGEYDHMNDALGYMIDWLWPVSRERQPDPYAPKRWQHKIAA